MKITLIRHGETAYNHRGLIQGLTDNPLNEQGVEQAIAAGKYLKKHGYHFDHIYSSPLSRAKRTAEEIAKQLDFKGEIQLDKRFVERDFGEYEGQEAKPILPHIYDDLPGDYEHHEAIETRVMNAIQDCIKNGGKHILIVCHAHVIKSVLVKLDEEFTYYNFLVNTSINNLEYIDGKLVVKAINVNEHLD